MRSYQHENKLDSILPLDTSVWDFDMFSRSVGNLELSVPICMWINWAFIWYVI